jgi:hypothetical protein
MRFDVQGKAFKRAALVAAALALTACVPSAYVYDDLPTVRYRSGGAPYPAGGYYGYPGYLQYYATPGYYSHSPYPPRVVYYGHDHRGDDCQHPGHRDGRRDDDSDRHDRNDDRNDGGRPPQDRDGRPDRRPPGEGPAADGGCAGSSKCRPATAPRSEAEPRGMRALRVKQPADADQKFERRKDRD